MSEGTAAERTALAWVRTMLAYAVCWLLCLRLAAGSLPVDATVLGLATVGSGGIAVLAARRRRYSARDVPIDPVATAVLAALVAGLGVAAAVLVAAH